MLIRVVKVYTSITKPFFKNIKGPSFVKQAARNVFKERF